MDTIVSEINTESNGILTIDGIVDPFIHPVDLFPEVSRVKVQVRFFLGEKVVESRIEHADDLRRLIVRDSMLLLIP